MGKKVTVTYKGKKYTFVPSNCLLRDLRSLGIRIDSGCLMGMCGACRMRKKKGEVSYRSKPMFPLKDDEILTCIGRAHTDIELDDVELDSI